ncbi:thioesterase family protein [Myxococcota bacterium]|nr:thioesterase family protein [Myxococcota bacterium]
MTHPFDLTTTPTRAGEGRYALSLSPGWGQGRALFGGVLAAAAARGLTDAVGDPSRRLRSLTVHFCEPAAPGEAELQVETARAGRYVSHLRAQVLQGGRVTTFASATFGVDRDAPMSHLDAPDHGLGGPEDALEVPMGGEGFPEFTRHIQYRFAGTTLPYGGGEVAAVNLWMRLMEPRALDLPALVALLDAGPPALLSKATGPIPMSSMDLRVQLNGALPDEQLRPGRYVLLTSRCRWAGAGYADQDSALWSEGGVLLARCQQALAFFQRG